MEQSQNNKTQLQASSLYLRDIKDTAENKGNAELARGSQDVSQANASKRNANEQRGSYTFSIDDAEHYFLDAGYEVASRTISHYCNRNQFRCKKFPANGVRRWFIEKASLDKHVEQMRHDGHAVASKSKRTQEPPKPAEEKESANSQDISQASASERNASANMTQRYIETLEKELEEKNRQMDKLQKTNDQLAAIANGLGFLLRNPEDGDNSRSEREPRDVE